MNARFVNNLLVILREYRAALRELGIAVDEPPPAPVGPARPGTLWGRPVDVADAPCWDAELGVFGPPHPDAIRYAPEACVPIIISCEPGTIDVPGWADDGEPDDEAG